jgi:hypothetical protein
MTQTGNRAFRKKTHSADSVFVLILICAFAICSLFVILFGAQVYNGIRVRSEENDNVRTGLMYLRSKVRAYDRPGGVSADALHAGSDVLMLMSEPFWGIFYEVTYIFYREGALHEYSQLHVVGDDPIDLNQVASQFIMPASGFRADEENPGVFTVTVYCPEGLPYATTVAVRSQTGGSS